MTLLLELHHKFDFLNWFTYKNTFFFNFNYFLDQYFCSFFLYLDLLPAGLALGTKVKGSFGPLKVKYANFKGSNSHVILLMRSCWIVPFKQALCHDLVPLFNKSWDKSLMIGRWLSFGALC